MIRWSFVLTLLWSSSGLAAKAPCTTGISETTTKRIFEVLREHFPTGCHLEGVSTQKAELQVQWSAGGTVRSPIRVRPRDCTLEQTGGELVVDVPPEFHTLCPGAQPLLEALDAAVGREQAVGAPRKPPSVWWFILCGWAVALAVPWSRRAMLGLLRRGGTRFSELTRRGAVAVMAGTRVSVGQAAETGTHLARSTRRRAETLARTAGGGSALALQRAVRALRRFCSGAVATTRRRTLAALAAIARGFRQSARGPRERTGSIISTLAVAPRTLSAAGSLGRSLSLQAGGSGRAVAARAAEMVRRSAARLDRLARTPRGQLVLALAVAAVGAWWLNRVTPLTGPDHDTTEDMLLVRDCVELGTCHTSSRLSTLGNTTQGAVWLELLTAVFLAGGKAVAARTLVILLLSVGLAVLFSVAWRWVRPATALPATLLALAALAVDAGDTQLVEPSTIFFTATVCAGATLIHALSSRPWALVIAAIFASHAANMHNAGYAFLPGVCLVAALASRWPVLGVLSSAGLFAATGWLTSRGAMIWNSTRPGIDQVQWAMLAGLALIAAVGLVAHRRFKRLTPASRSVIVAMGLLGPYAAGTVWLFLIHRPVTEKYLLAAVGPAALVVSALMVALLERVATGPRFRWAPRYLPVATGVMAVVFLSGHREFDWTYQDGAAVTRVLAARGWSHSLLEHRIQTKHCQGVLSTMAPFTPRQSAGVPGNRQVRLWIDHNTAPASPPPGAVAVAVNRSRAVIISEIDSWMDVGQAQSCRIPLAPGFRERCQGMPDPMDESNASSFSPRSRETPPTPLFRRYLPNRETVTIPLRPKAGETRGIRVFSQDDDAPERCHWHIVRVDGLESQSRLPAESASVRSQNGTPGSLVLERIYGSEGCSMDRVDSGELPCLLETTDDDPPWLTDRREVAR